VSPVFSVDECERCGHVTYPPRILCPVCAGSSFRRRQADSGVVDEVTTRRPVFTRRRLPSGDWLDESETRLGTVRTDAGPRIVVRVAEGVQRGDRVALHAQAGTAIALPEGSRA
jgi:uncharacterized OB-fold protein